MVDENRVRPRLQPINARPGSIHVTGDDTANQRTADCFEHRQLTIQCLGIAEFFC